MKTRKKEEKKMIIMISLPQPSATNQKRDVLSTTDNYVVVLDCFLRFHTLRNSNYRLMCARSTPVTPVPSRYEWIIGNRPSIKYNRFFSLVVFCFVDNSFTDDSRFAICARTTVEYLVDWHQLIDVEVLSKKPQFNIIYRIFLLRMNRQRSLAQWVFSFLTNK